MKRFNYILFLFLFTGLFLYSCKKDHSIVPDEEGEVNNPVDSVQKTDTIAYDIILIVGQSNTHSGIGIDPLLDAPDPAIFQLGRFDDHNNQIIPAVEPLEHYTLNPQKIGFALSFAKMYKSRFLLPGRKILIIPCGMGDTGFRKRRWNKGDDLYEDAVDRSNRMLAGHPRSKMIAILWHQGEADLNNPSYQSALDNMIRNMRSDIKSGSGQQLPFILGGMVPYWVDQDPSRMAVENIIKSTPERVEFAGYADPRNPSLIQKENPDTDATHYNAAGRENLQKDISRRY